MWESQAHYPPNRIRVMSDDGQSAQSADCEADHLMMRPRHIVSPSPAPTHPAPATNGHSSLKTITRCSDERRDSQH